MDEGICIAREHATPSITPALDSLPTDRREGLPPKQDMPRERLLKFGPGALSNSDLIALILGSGLPGRNVFEMARTLLQRFGSMHALLNATEKDFTGLHGIGPAKIAQLLAIIEMVR